MGIVERVEEADVGEKIGGGGKLEDEESGKQRKSVYHSIKEKSWALLKEIHT